MAAQRVKLEKNLHIMIVESLHEELEEIVQAGDELELDGGQVEKCDTACLQLLVAVNQSLQQRESSIQWVATSEVLVESAQRLGLAQFIGLEKQDASA